jgi:hypothetical protein
MMHDVIEHPFHCPYCGEPITMLLDTSSPEQCYVEDCEVCCNPISVSFRVAEDSVVEFDAQSLE